MNVMEAFIQIVKEISPVIMMVAFLFYMYKMRE